MVLTSWKIQRNGHSPILTVWATCAKLLCLHGLPSFNRYLHNRIAKGAIGFSLSSNANQLHCCYWTAFNVHCCKDVCQCRLPSHAFIESTTITNSKYIQSWFLDTQKTDTIPVNVNELPSPVAFRYPVLLSIKTMTKALRKSTELMKCQWEGLFLTWVNIILSTPKTNKHPGRTVLQTGKLDESIFLCVLLNNKVSD